MPDKLSYDAFLSELVVKIGGMQIKSAPADDDEDEQLISDEREDDAECSTPKIAKMNRGVSHTDNQRKMFRLAKDGRCVSRFAEAPTTTSRTSIYSVATPQPLMIFLTFWRL
jgi:hypothetical protein